MAEWLEQVSQGHDVWCQDLEVMSSNLGQAELGVSSTSALSRTWTKNNSTVSNAQQGLGISDEKWYKEGKTAYMTTDSRMLKCMDS